MQLYQFDHISSTMDVAYAYAAQGHILPFCILAQSQNSGIGTRGRIWASPKGNFYASFAFPFLNMKSGSQISLITGISVAQILSRYHIPIELKWCNDLMIKYNKVGGILCVVRDNILYIGIGINFKFAPDLPSDHMGYFSSDFIRQSFYLSYADFALILGEELKFNLKHYENSGFIDFLPLWQKNAAFLNQVISVILPNNTVKTGINRGLHIDGSLIFETQGVIEYLYSARITQILDM